MIAMVFPMVDSVLLGRYYEMPGGCSSVAMGFALVPPVSARVVVAKVLLGGCHAIPGGY